MTGPAPPQQRGERLAVSGVGVGDYLLGPQPEKQTEGPCLEERSLSLGKITSIPGYHSQEYIKEFISLPGLEIA